jgi:cytochrome-b5 reductase
VTQALFWEGWNMRLKAKVLMTEFVTHDVKRFVLTKPRTLRWRPGQGTLLAIDKRGLRDEAHPFTPTSLREAHVLEYTIKGYPRRRGMTGRLHRLKPGDGLLIKMVFGDIRYEGPGTFIAGGAGVTPFVAILRRLAADGKLAGNSLIFSNKTWKDVILERELRGCLGERCVFTLTDEKRPGYEHRHIGRRFLAQRVRDFRQRFYVCGPPKFVLDVTSALTKLGADPDKLVFDEP